MTQVLTESQEVADAPHFSKEHMKVVNFRLTWLLYAGYKPGNADKIAHATDIDWHFACDLRKKCSSECLCMKILF